MLLFSPPPPASPGLFNCIKSVRISLISPSIWVFSSWFMWWQIIWPTYIITSMTIHTKWMELLRDEASDSFHRAMESGVVDASFIDGQIKLMKGDSIRTWWGGVSFSATGSAQPRPYLIACRMFPGRIFFSPNSPPSSIDTSTSTAARPSCSRSTTGVTFRVPRP